MAVSIGIGFSQNLDIEEAAKEAAFQSKSDLEEDRVDFSIILSTIHYPPEKLLPTIQLTLGAKKTIGCSTAGIIHSLGIFKRGVAVLSITSDDIQFGTSVVEQASNYSAEHVGVNLAQEAIRSLGAHARQTFLFLMDDKIHHISDTLKGMQQVFGNVFPIAGAGSSDDFHFDKTYQIFNQQSLSNAMVGLLIGGQTTIGIGARHGWRPLGKPRRINEADGHIIKKIDGKKAIHLYQEYFGSTTTGVDEHRLENMSILYPLGINIEGGSEYILRNTVNFQNDGSILCQGDLPVGAEVHLMIGNKESCKTAAKEAAWEAHQNLFGKKAQLILVFESLSRLKLLGREAHTEIKMVREVFGANTPIFGMYSNGEVSPFQTVEKFKKSYHLNESIVVVAIGQ